MQSMKSDIAAVFQKQWLLCEFVAHCGIGNFSSYGCLVRLCQFYDWRSSERFHLANRKFFVAPQFQSKTILPFRKLRQNDFLIEISN